MAELLSCPFCGGEARIHEFADVPDCGGCHALGPVADTVPEAIAAWNRRALPAGGEVEPVATAGKRYVEPTWPPMPGYYPASGEAVPVAADGWVLVPPVATRDMIRAGLNERDRIGSGAQVSAIYRAMITAAPPSLEITDAMVERATDALYGTERVAGRVITMSKDQARATAKLALIAALSPTSGRDAG